MSWFRRKNQPEIPPVAQPPAPNNPYQSSSTPAPSYRSNASTYVASRDGDLSDPRAWGKDPNAFGGGQQHVQQHGQQYGQPQSGYNQPGYGSDPGKNNGYGGGYGNENNRPTYGRSDSGYGGSGSANGGSGGDYDRPSYGRKDSGYGGQEASNNNGYDAKQSEGRGYGTTNSGWTGPRESPFDRGQAGREAFDPYSRGERNLEADRNALFAGSAPPQGGQQVNRFGGQSYGERRPAPNPGEETEEDLEGLKRDIRNVKMDTKSTTSRALELARQAEQTGMSTLVKLGKQSEKLAETERNLDESKGQMYRAEDNTDDIRKLNRSIFIPAVTFNKEKKRLAQERRREMRFMEEQEDRALAMQDIRETQNRVGRTQTYSGRSGDDDDGEGIDRPQTTSGQMRLREEERKRYMFEATESDEEIENGIGNDLDAIAGMANKLKTIGLSMNSELDSQNNRVDRISSKTDKLGIRVQVGTSKLTRLQR